MEDDMRMCSLFLLLLSFLAMAQQPDPWPAGAIIQPAALAEQVKAKKAPQIIYVGFPVLYKGAHIPGASFNGPCSKQEGIDLLLQSVKEARRDAEIVIYCGCCPFVRCPNIRPAYKALKDKGFTNIKVLQLDTNLHTDWVEKGFPIEK